MYATHENVKRAIETLQGRGQKITVRAVREAIGGGSLEDIGELIGRVLMGEPAADDSPALPALPYDLPTPDPDIIQHHLAQLEGEAQALALMDHLHALVNAARAVQVTAQPATNWLFRAVTQMGEVAGLGMDIGNLADDLARISASAAAMLTRMRREYQRVNAHDDTEVLDGTIATAEPQ